MERAPIEPPICIALDTADLQAALRIVDSLEGAVPVFKVGLELFAAAGPEAVSAVRSRGVDVFCDLKVNDIPNQAAGAVRAAARIDVRFMTVHANAGRASVRAAVDAATGTALQILVVSVLTSLDDEGLREVGVERRAAEQVSKMAELAAAEGASGLVLGAGELTAVRKRHPDLLLVTPGIRPASTAVGDQRRVGTPGAAITSGADLLVLGRPVTAAAEPRVALDSILEEIDEARGRTASRAPA